MMKKNKLLALINECIEMLSLCEYEEQADKFQECLEVLQNSEISSDEFQKGLNDISRILAGMYSFSELSLIPKRKTNLTAADIRLRQWNLVTEIGKVIKQLKTNNASITENQVDSDTPSQ